LVGKIFHHGLSRKDKEHILTEIELANLLKRGGAACPRYLSCYKGLYRDKDGTEILIMDLAPGESLWKWASKQDWNKPEAVQQLKEVILQTLKALEEFQALGIVHNDISANNIMVGGDNPLHVTIVDYGELCKLPDCRDDISAFTFPSPERQMRKNRDLRFTLANNDMFSLGVTLYFTIARKNPFDKDTFNIKRSSNTLFGRDPLKWKPVSPLQFPQDKCIENVVNSMLVADPEKRDTAKKALEKMEQCERNSAV